VSGGEPYVLYWMTAYRRTHFNYALERAVFWAAELRKPLLIFEPLTCNYRWASIRFHQFVVDGMREKLEALQKTSVTYRPYVEARLGEGKRLFARLMAHACLIVTDDYPAFETQRWIEKVASRAKVLVEKVDSNGIFPMRATNRLFLTASSFRRFHEKQTTPQFPLADPLAGLDLPRLSTTATSNEICSMPASLDRTVGSVSGVKGGSAAARERLRTFIDTNAASSRLSPYLHFGHISSHEVYRTVFQNSFAESPRPAAILSRDFLRSFCSRGERARTRPSTSSSSTGETRTATALPFLEYLATRQSVSQHVFPTISYAAERLRRWRPCYSSRVKRRDVQIKFRPLRTKGGPDEDDLRLSIEERVALVWPLTLDAWAFKGEPVAESRLPRHIVRVLRGRR
jgi:deoxyribodipyrimidine photolyase